MIKTYINKLYYNTTQTILIKPVSINMQKCYYTGNLVSSIARKVISPQVIAEERNLLINKFIFSRYCLHFKNKSLGDLLNDKQFIIHMHNMIHNEPTLYSRAFQLALEVTYFKRRFSETVLQEIYKNDFIVSDAFNVNKGICDQSTVYSAILAKKLVDNFNLNVQDLTVNSTPLFLTKEKVTEDIQMTMITNKKLTNNSCPDIILKGQPYDFKEQKDFCFSKNQIYFIDIESIAHKGVLILNQLEKTLVNSSKNSSLSNEVLIFTRDIVNNIKQQRNSGKPIEVQLENITSLLIKSHKPCGFTMPLFIPIKKFEMPLIPTQEVEKVSLEKGHLEAIKAKRAIMGILDSYDPQLKRDIQQITHNSIQFSSEKAEEID